MKQINLELTVKEINLILKALGNLPFIRVHELISKIHQQANPQVNGPRKYSEQSCPEDAAAGGEADHV